MEPAGPWPLDARWNDQTGRSKTDEFGKTLYAHTVEADRKVVEAVATVAKERGVPRAQIALAWVLAKSEVSAPIIGASKHATFRRRDRRARGRAYRTEIAR